MKLVLECSGCFPCLMSVVKRIIRKEFLFCPILKFEIWNILRGNCRNSFQWKVKTLLAFLTLIMSFQEIKKSTKNFSKASLSFFKIIHCFTNIGALTLFPWSEMCSSFSKRWITQFLWTFLTTYVTGFEMEKKHINLKSIVKPEEVEPSFKTIFYNRILQNNYISEKKLKSYFRTISNIEGFPFPGTTI